MTPILQQAINRAEEQTEQLKEVTRALHHGIFSYLASCGYLRDIDGNVDGIVLYPLASPHDLRKAFQELIPEACFSRVLEEGGLYSWQTTFPGYSLTVRIEANEHIDLTGTLVTDPTK